MCVCVFVISDRGKVIGGLPDVVTIMEKKVRCIDLSRKGHVASASWSTTQLFVVAGARLGLAGVGWGGRHQGE